MVDNSPGKAVNSKGRTYSEEVCCGEQRRKDGHPAVLWGIGQSSSSVHFSKCQVNVVPK